MPQFVLSAVAHLIANAIGLLLATFLLEGFNMSLLAMVIVVLVFTIVSVLLHPLIRKVSEKKAPQLLGGLSLVVTFAGLLITEILVSGFSIGGVANLLAATLIVWLGALIAGIVVPKYLFPSLGQSNAAK